MTLIDYYSCVDGKLDEDLRHSILLHLLEKIPKFEI
ncbi:helix-turn-helix domain-containing protein [Acutalibacter sp. 1XD8-33]